MLICITASGRVSSAAIQDLIEDFFKPYTEKEIITSDTEQAVINSLRLAEIPVYDLSKGLYPVLGEIQAAEMAVEPRTQTGWYDQMQTGVEDASVALRAVESLSLSELLKLEQDLKNLEETVHHAVRIKEGKMHQVYVNGVKKMDDDEVKELLGLVPIGNSDTGDFTHFTSGPEKIRCYRSKRGIIRKAGKSKPRPGEEEVYLTQEEIDERN